MHNFYLYKNLRVNGLIYNIKAIQYSYDHISSLLISTSCDLKNTKIVISKIKETIEYMKNNILEKDFESAYNKIITKKKPQIGLPT